LLLEAQADFITAKAEITVVKLEDGSAATLGPESAIKLAFDDRARRIQLLSGMAYFEVARDEARPFSVTSDQLTATALGTAFDVAADAGYTSVSVQHGSVEVRMPHVQSERLEPGQWLSLEGSAQLIERGSRDAGQIAAVVSRIGRWHTGSIVLADPDLGARQVSGVFDLGQPLRALEAVVHPYGGKVRQIAPWVTIISKI
jgi:transmembrane sensor